MIDAMPYLADNRIKWRALPPDFLADRQLPLRALAPNRSRVTALLRQIGSCGVVLLPDSMRVENLIRSYRIPYVCVRDVDVAPTGGLEIETLQREVVRCFAFGGSLVDAFFKTSKRAAIEVEERVDAARGVSAVGENELTHEIRHCWSSDILFGLAALFAIVGTLAIR